MSLEQAILEAVRSLPSDKQQEILGHAKRLREQSVKDLATGDRIKAAPFKSIKGLWADLGVFLSAEEIEKNQRAMWESFPRESV